MVLEALRHAVRGADIIGGRVIVVDARSAKVAAFYQQLSFLPAGAMTPLKLYMRIATARSLIAAFDSGDTDEDNPLSL